MTNAAATTFAIRGLMKSFDGRPVLRGVELDAAKGKSLVIIGGSGSGKSVLLRCLLGVIRADSGQILLDGEDLGRLPPAARARRTRRIGMLFQGAALFDSLPVWENIAFRTIYGEGGARSKARLIAEECLAKVGLAPEVGALYPAALSGGMQKRVGLARAIAGDPDILFFDEPTTGLDPIMADVINNLIVERVRALGATAISITHDMASTRKIADEIAMLYEGRIIWRGAPDELDRSGNPMVDQFVNGRADGPIRMAIKSS